MAENYNDRNTFTIFDVTLVLLKNKKLILRFTIITMIVIFAISVYSLVIPNDSPFNILPNIYKSAVKILVTLPGESKLPSLASSNGVSSLLGVMGGGTLSQSVGRFIESLFALNEIRDKIIDEFHFIERYNIKKFPITGARELFAEKLFIEMNLEETILTVAFEDKDPVFATNVLRRTVDEVMTKYADLNLQSVRKKRESLEESAQVAEDNYYKLQDEFIAFQKEHGIFDISTQTKKAIEQLAKLKAELAKKELELDGLLEYFSENDPKVIRKKREIENARQVISEAERGTGVYADQFIPQDEIPELARKYKNLELELSIQAAVYKMLRQQYEAARIEEMDKTTQFQILEPAEIPERKDHPSRVLLIIIFTLSAFLLSVIIAFIKEYIQRAEKDVGENEKIAGIKKEASAFCFFKRKKKRV